MNHLSGVVEQLRKEREQAANVVRSLDAALAALGSRGKARATRYISAAGRARIAAAQRARWAKLRGKKVVSMPKKKRTISAAGRARIAAAARARWAKFRAAKS